MYDAPTLLVPLDSSQAEVAFSQQNRFAIIRGEQHIMK